MANCNPPGSTARNFILCAFHDWTTHTPPQDWSQTKAGTRALVPGISSCIRFMRERRRIGSCFPRCPGFEQICEGMVINLETKIAMFGLMSKRFDQLEVRIPWTSGGPGGTFRAPLAARAAALAHGVHPLPLGAQGKGERADVASSHGKQSIRFIFLFHMEKAVRSPKEAFVQGGICLTFDSLDYKPTGCIVGAINHYKVSYAPFKVLLGPNVPPTAQSTARPALAGGAGGHTDLGAGAGEWQVLAAGH